MLHSQTSEFGVAITLEDQPDLQDIPGFFQVDDGNFWVAVDGDAIVGTIAAKDIGEGRLVLRKMFVVPAYRGKVRGTAKRLLDTLLAWAASRGKREVLLGTIHMMHAARRFYEQSGFVEVAKSDLPPGFPVMAVDDRFYRLRL